MPVKSSVSHIAHPALSSAQKSRQQTKSLVIAAEHLTEMCVCVSILSCVCHPWVSEVMSLSGINQHWSPSFEGGVDGAETKY